MAPREGEQQRDTSARRIIRRTRSAGGSLDGYVAPWGGTTKSGREHQSTHGGPGNQVVDTYSSKGGKSTEAIARYYATARSLPLDANDPQAVAAILDEIEQARQQSDAPSEEHRPPGTSARPNPPLLIRMATRNKPRSNHITKEEAGDPHEEQTLWTNIRNDIGKLVLIQKKQITVGEKIKDAKEAIDKSSTPTARQYEELDALLREQIKLCQEEQKLLREEPADIIRSVEILKALRAASGDGGRSSSGGSGPKDRQRKSKAGSASGSTSGAKIDDGTVSIGSPGLSPVATAARLKHSARAGSVASVRDAKESSVKTEDGEGGLKLGADGNTGLGAEKAGRFFVGAEVAYKQARPKEDGSQWIQCTIVGITEKNGKRRYEVEDADVDDSEEPGVVYTAGASTLIAIPPKGTELPELPAGKAVLAQYPDTTVFYRAKVVGYDDKTGQCRLKFEEDQDREMVIDRRLVLSLDK